ncbi:hypothetical protein KAU51_02630 [Candidatus Parcubacteria bacterium]|nr:hypothetical protein [Candidatus Parcubacteria bacterium]
MMIKVLRTYKIIQFIMIFFVITAWVFSGWPQILDFPPKIQEAKTSNETLYVSGFTSINEQWTEFGSSPWLDNNTANYIYTKTDEYWHEEFTFIDPSASGAINSVKVYLELKIVDTLRNDSVEVYIHDGTAWSVKLGDINPSSDSYYWENVDISGTLDTWAKITAAKLKVKYDKSGSPSTTEIYIRRAYLYVDYSLTSTLSTGTDPGAATIAPGGVETDVDQFVITTSSGTETITDVTVNLSTANGIGRLNITDSANTELGFTTSPAADSNVINVSGMSAGTEGTTFKVRATPKTHSLMPAVPGAEYAITAPVTAWTGTGGYTHLGSDTNPNALTIDNLSPNGATVTSGSEGDTQVTLNWTTSSSSDFSRSVVLRWAAATPGSEVPAEGTDYTVDQTITTATVACMRTGDAASAGVSGIDGAGTGGCSAVALTNDQDYSYKVFQKDSNGNYDAGVIFTGSPFTPSSAPTLSFSITNNAVGFGTWPDTNKRWANSAETGDTGDPGAGQATQLGASTNSTSGLVITVRSQGSGTSAGLYKSYGTTHLIDAVGPSSVANATEGYAVYGASAYLLTITAGFAVDGTTLLTTSAQTFASASGAVDSGTVDVKPIAGITNTTPAGSYSDSLTFICTGTF